jgi:drug/metabolite transporter (DMT)-like permease
MNKTTGHIFKPMFAAATAAIVMGTLGYFVKESHLAANTMAFFRFLIGALVMSVLVVVNVIRRHKKLQFSASSFFSGLAIGCCILFYFKAITMINIGIACFLLYIGPAFAIVGEALLIRRFPSRRNCFILFASLLGVLFLSQIVTSSSGVGTLHGFGLCIALLSAVSYGTYILLNRRIPEKVDLCERTFWQFWAGVAVILVSFLIEKPSWEHVSASWIYILIVGLIHGVLVLFLVAYAIKYLSAMQYGTLSYLEPIVATVLGFLCYSEVLSVLQVVGIALILIAAILQCLPEKQK